MAFSAGAILFGCLFLLLVVLVEHIARRWMFPVVGWLLVVGLGYGLARRLGLNWLPTVVLSPEIVVLVFLPLLIFGSSRKIPVRALVAEWPEITYLSFIGPLVGMFLLALPLVLLGWLHAMLFGAALAATDPLAVGALLKKMHVPRRLLALIEGESLLNDAVVIILFSALSSAALGESELSLPASVGGLVYSLVGAVALGMLAGGLVGGLLRAWHDMHDRFIGAVLPLVMAYGVFALAHSILHVSGVVAVVAATLTLTSLHTHCERRTEAQMRSDNFFEDFWDFLDTLANAVLFFGIGAMVGQHEWLLPWILVPMTCVALVLSRIATVYPMGLIAGVAGRRIPLAWQHMVAASGLRGGLSVVLLLSLPASYQYRVAMLCIAFALLLFSLAAYMASDRFYLCKVDLSEHGTSPKGARP